MTARWSEIDTTLKGIVGALALGLLLFSCALVALGAIGLKGKVYDLAVFFVAAAVLPVVCSVLLGGLGPARRLSVGESVEAATVLLVTLMLCALCLLAMMRSRVGGFDLSWARGASIIVFVAALLHVLLVARRSVAQSSAERLTSTPGRRRLLAACFASAFSFAVIALLWISEKDGIWPAIVTIFWIPPFDPAGGTGFGVALALAIAGVAFATCLGAVELWLLKRHPRLVGGIRRLSLLGAIAAVVLFFDLSFPSDALHYMTNAAPAQQFRHGGVLMSDTFSQYGLGPIVANYVGFLFLPTTLSAANLTAQLFNLAFYAVWLVCLYRLSPLRVPALALGLMVIPVLLAFWGLGVRNINFAPSILGMRYLPILLMVAAISCLNPPAKFSGWVSAATFFSSLWSFEALVGSLGVHAAFLFLRSAQARSWAQFAGNMLRALLPVAAALGALSAYTLANAARLPEYRIYLDYLSVYSFLSPAWAIPASPRFFGWAAPLAVVFLVLVDALSRALGQNELLPASADHLHYKIVPMALLCVVMSAYYLGRSVEYTIVLTLLPLAALLIAASLQWSTWCIAGGQRRKLALLALPVGALVFGLTFAIASLSRSSSPYAFFPNECIQRGNCSVWAIVDLTRTKLSQRPALEQTGNLFSDAYLDRTGTVRDAVALLGRLQPDRALVVVLLGPIHNTPIIGKITDQMASDIALMYSGKWHRWPRSFTFADEIIPRRVTQILGKDVQLDEGELVLVRRNEALLGAIETGILRRIRAEMKLCELSESTAQVAAYRVSRAAACPR